VRPLYLASGANVDAGVVSKTALRTLTAPKLGIVSRTIDERLAAGPALFKEIRRDARTRGVTDATTIYHVATGLGVITAPVAIHSGALMWYFPGNRVPPASRVRGIAGFVSDILLDGPVPLREIVRRANDAGISEATVYAFGADLRRHGILASRAATGGDREQRHEQIWFLPSETPFGPDAIAEASRYLRERLAGGSRPVEHLVAEAQARGIDRWPFNYAAVTLNVRLMIADGGRKIEWYLP
jgi:hypothetical protein